MSIRAIDWVLRTEIKPISDKFILVVIANYANSFGLSYPSRTRLRNVTGYDRKTIGAALSRLKFKGLIEDSGKRVGLTKSIIVYRLPWAIEDEEAGPVLDHLPENGSRPTFDGSRPNSPPKQAQSTLENRQEPSVLTVNEPSEVEREKVKYFLGSLLRKIQTGKDV